MQLLTHHPAVHMEHSPLSLLGHQRTQTTPHPLATPLHSKKHLLDSQLA
jgi:hypothetical protein